MGGVVVSIVASAALSTITQACNKTSSKRITLGFGGHSRYEFTNSTYKDCQRESCRTSIANPNRTNNIFQGEFTSRAIANLPKPISSFPVEFQAKGNYQRIYDRKKDSFKGFGAGYGVSSKRQLGCTIATDDHKVGLYQGKKAAYHGIGLNPKGISYSHGINEKKWKKY